MARRIRKSDVSAIFWLIVIGIPIYGLVSFQEAVGWEGVGISAAFIIGGYLVYRYARHKAEESERRAREQEHLERLKARRMELMKKYGDEKMVTAIMNHSYWPGQTAEQLSDSLGPPVDTDEKVLKTKRKEVWKYHQQGQIVSDFELSLRTASSWDGTRNYRNAWSNCVGPTTNTDRCSASDQPIPVEKSFRMCGMRH